MDKITVGIPRSIFIKYENFWKYYFEKLNIKIIFSKLTDKGIIDLGMKYANDEMCMSFKTFLGHIAYLQDKCDYVLVPRINNYGIKEQMCTNFMAAYDIVNNLFETPVLNYNVDYENQDTELKALIKIGKILEKTKEECEQAYEYAKVKEAKLKKKIYIEEYNKLHKEGKKILLVGHDYLTFDNMIGSPIIKYIKKMDCEVILGNYLSSNVTSSLSSLICKHLYWKSNKELVGAIELCKDKVDGIILISSFPCGPDALVNELVIRRVNKPILQLVVDDVNSFTGIETRLESFIDII